MTKKIILANKEEKGKRLDIFLLEQMQVSRAQAQKIIKDGLVELNGRITSKTGHRLLGDDKILIRPEKKVISSAVEPVDYSLLDQIQIVAEDKDYLVVNKPAGLLVHPTEAQEPVSMTKWILDKYPKLSKVGDNKDRPGIVHRLDKDTSGLLVIAKNQKMFVHLKKQFKNREIEKYYFALVHGQIDSTHEIINFPIDRGQEGRMVSRAKINQITLKNVNKIFPGKEAVTEFWVEKKFINFTFLKIRLHTGRTHQIRVHLFAYNHPVVGDKIYFNKRYKSDLGRLFLHSYRLCFNSLKGEQVCFETGLPEQLENYLEKAK